MKVVSIFLFLFITTASIDGQVTNVAAGLWSNAALWSNNHIPTSNDSVYLSYNITIDVNANCKALNTNGKLVTVNPGIVLNILSNPADIDGNIYNTIAICKLVCMSENLTVSRYRNGDSIPEVTDSVQWINLQTGGWCWYNNDSAAYAATYGKLYNWFAIHDPRGLSPAGWHIPSGAEWKKIIKCISPAADTSFTIVGRNLPGGGAMKEIGLTHWLSPNTDATNTSGFSGLPGGYRSGADNSIGISNYIGKYGYFWSATNVSGNNSAWYISLSYNDNLISMAYTDTGHGFSVRCIRD